MDDDAIKKFLMTQDAISRQLEPLRTVIQSIEQDSGFRRLIESAQQSQEAMRAAFGPIEELRRTGLLDELSKVAALSQETQAFLNRMQYSFRLPEISEAAKLIAQIDTGGIGSVLEEYQEQALQVQRAMESMRTPWVDIQDQLRSVTGFAELQGIGHALRTMPAFGDQLAEALRFGLGDWQIQIEWPPDIFTDVLARTAFYTERGLDPALTAFPPEAFRQGLTLAGLGTSPLEFEAYPEILSSDGNEDEEEDGFERTNAAHDLLMRFETRLRRFINEQMSAVCGESWIKQRVPGPILTMWRDKRLKAKDNGEPEKPLIEYADFTDYVIIITRKDNWQDVFKPFFRRETFVQESFQRLYPIRICTMHARLITQDDELYLHVETKRILAAMGVMKGN